PGSVRGLPLGSRYRSVLVAARTSRQPRLRRQKIHRKEMGAMAQYPDSAPRVAPRTPADAAPDGRSESEKEPLHRLQFRGSSAEELEEWVRTHRPKWLVEGVMVKDQALVVGGPVKTLKTSLCVDLAVSLASGTPFLGKFGVPSPCRVMVISGEMGEPTLLRTAQRVGKARGLAGLPGDIIWEFGTIPLGRRPGIQALAILTRRRRARVVIIDPLYLSLLKGAKGRNPASLLDMGPLLYEIGDTCLEWGCTPVLVHHATKKVWPGR